MCAAHFHFQAKNEQDPSAIAALLQSLRLDPGNCEAIIALAASLTNESMQSHACYALQGRLFEKTLKEGDSKGHLISKGLVGILNSFKKRTKKFDLQYYAISGCLVFICFFGRM